MLSHVFPPGTALKHLPQLSLSSSTSYFSLHSVIFHSSNSPRWSFLSWLSFLACFTLTSRVLWLWSTILLHIFLPHWSVDGKHFFVLKAKVHEDWRNSFIPNNKSRNWISLYLRMTRVLFFFKKETQLMFTFKILYYIRMDCEERLPNSGYYNITPTYPTSGRFSWLHMIWKGTHLSI